MLCILFVVNSLQTNLKVVTSSCYCTNIQLFEYSPKSRQKCLPYNRLNYCNRGLIDKSQQQIIIQNLQLVHVSKIKTAFDTGDCLDISQDPMNEFRSEGLICLVFPALFPGGRGDLSAPRSTIQSHLYMYFKYLMTYHHGRFAKDVRFPYYSHNFMAEGLKWIREDTSSQLQACWCRSRLHRSNDADQRG